MRDISLKRYATLPFDKRVVYEPLTSLEPKNKFGSYQLDINSLTWEEVKGVLRTLSKFNEWKSAIDIFETCFKIKEDVFWAQSIVDYFACSNYIKETFIAIKEKEIKLLHGISEDSALWEQAGGGSLDVFSDIIPLVQLGKIYGQYPMPLKDKPYNEVLTLLVINKNQITVQRQFDKLKAQQKGR